MRFLYLSLIFFLSICCRAENKRLFLIDSDVGVDDLIGIHHLLSSDKIEVVAITTTSNGASHYEYSSRNMLDFLTFIKKPHIPVARTKKYPLAINGSYPQDSRKYADTLNKTPLPRSPEEVSEIDSVDMLILKILEQDRKVNILCTGPLTNLAIALTKEPKIKNHIERIYFLGGAINVKGDLKGKHNGYYNRWAEYNIFLDVKAADIVMHAKMPITMIPLDALRSIESMTAEVYRRLVKIKRTPYEDFVFKNINPFNYPDATIEPSFWSSIAAAIILEKDIGNIVQLNLALNTEIGPYYGMISVIHEGEPLDVCLSLNYQNFYNFFIEAVLKED